MSSTGISLTVPRVALVTGAAGALGSAICRRLAQTGASVAVNDVDAAGAAAVADRLTRETGQRCIAAAADISDRGAVAGMVAAVSSELGPVDTLVNNAGILRNAPLLEMSEEDWDSLIDVHLKGAFLCSQSVVGPMAARGFGRIVNISSGAVRGSGRGHANYASAKAGLIGLTTTLAVELGPAGITVNAVAPGAIRSDMTRSTAKQIGETFETYEQRMAGNIPARRLGEPEDVAEAVAFFASEAASYVNGQVLFVAGGPV
jgi:3-oxoacyl-[acyl-carrier protein] reductase